MRGREMFLKVMCSLKAAFRADHPLRANRKLADEALSVVSGRFEALYSPMGRLDPARHAASGDAVAFVRSVRR